MDRFKFRLPATSDTPSFSAQTRESGGCDDDLWMDDIDEQTLLQASQLAETANHKQKNAVKFDMDPETLHRIMEKDVESWKFEDMPRKTNLNPTQTVYGDESERLVKPSKDRLQFQNSFISSSSKPMASNTFAKPGNSSRIIVSPGVTQSEVTKETIEKLNNERKKLIQLQYSKAGEISFLRTELTKRQSNFDKEKQATENLLVLKSDEIKELERKKKKEIEGLKSERDFIQRELEQAQERIEKLEREKNLPRPANPNVSIPIHVESNGPLKRPSQTVSPRAQKKQKLFENLDDSFFEENTNRGKSTKLPLKNASVQTTQKRPRENKLVIEKDPVDLIGQIGTLAGIMALSTLSETRIPCQSSHCLQLVECLAQFCKSAYASYIELRKHSKNNSNSDDSAELNIDAEQRWKETLLGDLNGARIFAIELTKMKHQFQKEMEFELVSLESVMLLTEIMLQQSCEEDSWVFKTSCDTLSLVFENGLVSSSVIQSFLNEVKTSKIGKWLKDSSVSTKMFSKGVSSLLTIVGSICHANGSVLCSNSKDLCFIPFLWTLVDHLISGDTTSHDKEDVSAKQPVTFHCLSEETTQSGEEKDSLNVTFAEAFCQWLGPQLSQKNLPWIGCSKIASNDSVSSPIGKCKFCQNDLVKSLSAVTCSLVKECTNYEAAGLPSPSNCRSLVYSCLTSLHVFWSWDSTAFAKALGESPSIQRRYIWTTTQVAKMRKEFDLESFKVDIIADLSVECDDSHRLDLDD